MEITGGILHTPAGWPVKPSTRQAVIATDNERVVFGTKFLGYVRGSRSIKQSGSPDTKSVVEGPAIEASDTRPEVVAVFELCTRVEFPPTSLEFHVNGGNSPPFLKELPQSEPADLLARSSTSSPTAGRETVRAPGTLRGSLRFLYWKRQMQQMVLGIVLRRFHKYADWPVK